MIMKRRLLKLGVFLLLGSCVTSVCGCGSTARVTVTNQSNEAFRVRVVTPHPGYELFKARRRYEFDLQANARWEANRKDESDFSVMPNGGVVLRVCPKNLYQEGCTIYWCDATDYADIFISGNWPSLEVRARDQHGDELLVRDTSVEWFEG
jgi:hypothetical protein